MSRKPHPLRHGYTTGSCAAAGAKACVAALLGAGFTAPLTVTVPRPDDPVAPALHIPVQRIFPLPERSCAAAEVIKDGGDDPDVTHGSEIRCLVRLGPPLPQDVKHLPVRIEGGRGIGRVTLPGLPVAVGQAAINPGPRRQIALAVLQAMHEVGRFHEVDVLVESPQGARLAAKTMNPRLGIVHGISILGSSGTVKPFSHAAWRATVQAGLDVAQAMGHDSVALCTGRQSERLLREHLPELQPTACVQMADLFAFALAEAGARGFNRIVIGCFFGKLVKMAQGLSHTHADSGSLDFSALARRCKALGAAESVVRQVLEAVTARRVLDLAMEDGLAASLAKDLTLEAMQQARKHAGNTPRLDILAFSNDGTLLAEAAESSGLHCQRFSGIR